MLGFCVIGNLWLCNADRSKRRQGLVFWNGIERICFYYLAMFEKDGAVMFKVEEMMNF